MTGTPDRREAVSNLVHLRTSLDDAVAAARQFPWDGWEELVWSLLFSGVVGTGVGRARHSP